MLVRVNDLHVLEFGPQPVVERRASLAKFGEKRHGDPIAQKRKKALGEVYPRDLLEILLTLKDC